MTRFALLVLIVSISMVRAQTPDNDAGGSPPTMIVVNPAPPQTMLEKVEVLKSALVIRGYSDIGTIQSDDGAVVRVLAVELKIATTKERAAGIVIEIHNTGRFARTAISYIDAEEIDALAGALDSISKLDRNATELTDYDAHYRSKGDFEVENLNQNGARVINLKATQTLRPSGE